MESVNQRKEYAMHVIIHKITDRKHMKSKVQAENDVDREMRKCLTRLKVW